MATHDFAKQVSNAKVKSKGGFLQTDKEVDPYEQNKFNPNRGKNDDDNKSMQSNRSRKSNIHQPDNYDQVAESASKNNS